MAIVTFTSDFGNKDYYAAIIKGAMLRAHASLNIVDISHNVKTYDIVQGAFILKNVYPSFPQGSIHLVSVHDFSKRKACFLALRHEEHYFIGADNGLFSLMFEQTPKDIYELEYDPTDDFVLQSVYARAVGHIANGLPFNEIGIPLDDIEQRISLQPIINNQTIKGSIIHIDHYENLIVNIDRALFDRVGKGRPFALYFKRHDPLLCLSRHYTDVPVGERLCFFNSADYLEIAINMGKAASMLGLKKEDGIQVIFSGD
ncbi:MAG: SAM-dependent chlorinase/fluorinase [Bacteroidota bacterium]